MSDPNDRARKHDHPEENTAATWQYWDPYAPALSCFLSIGDLQTRGKGPSLRELSFRFTLDGDIRSHPHSRLLPPVLMITPACCAEGHA